MDTPFTEIFQTVAGNMTAVAGSGYPQTIAKAVELILEAVFHLVAWIILFPAVAGIHPIYSNWRFVHAR